MDLNILKKAIEHANDSIIITDKNLDKPGPKILYVNPAFTKMTGYSSKFAVGKSPRFLQGPKTDNNILNLMKKELLSKGVFKNEIINYKDDGSEYVIEWHISEVKNIKGELIAYVSIQRDITSRKKMELQLKKSKEIIEKKVLERTRQLNKLKEKLERYSLKLEKKVKDLEKSEINLSINEKKVLLSLINAPNRTDSYLSSKIDIKRSTFTSIKNRLLRKGWLYFIYIPDYSTFNIEILNIAYGKDSVSEISRRFNIIDKRFKNPENVIYISTNQDYFSISFIKNLLDFEKIRFDIGRNENSEIHSLGFCNILKFMNFNNTLSSIFELNNFFKDDKINFKNKNLPLKKLSSNDKEVLFSIIKDPNQSNDFFSDKLCMNINTFINIKNKLEDNGLIKKVAIPDLKKLNSYIIFIDTKFNKDKKTKIINDSKIEISKKLNEFIRIDLNHRSYFISLIKNFPEEEFELTSFFESLFEEGILTQYPEIIVMHPKQIKFNKIDFYSFTKKLL